MDKSLSETLKIASIVDCENFKMPSDILICIPQKN